MAKRKNMKATANATPQHKKAKTDGGEDASPKASLLGIPGEIRNRIYRLALVDGKPTRIDRQHCEEPGLLRACRQLRLESQLIYYKENEFDLFIDEFIAPSTPYWLWSKDVPQRNVWLELTGRPIYDNLKPWLQAFHGGRANRLHFADEDTGRERWVVKKLFNVVEKLKDLPWKRVEAVLADVKDAGWIPGCEMWVELDSDGGEMVPAY